MTLLDDLRASNSCIGWTDILVGWLGPGNYPPLITLEEVVTYSRDVIERYDAPELDWVARLANADTDEPEVVLNCLNHLRDLEKGDVGQAARKWRLTLLKRLMTGLIGDPLYDLIELTTFWQYFNFPSDSPHILQGFNNHISPEEYYTPSNLEHILAVHHRWIEREEHELQANCDSLQLGG